MKTSLTLRDVKIGDTIRLVRDSGLMAMPGATARVVDTNPAGNLVEVRWLTKSYGQADGSYQINRFEKFVQEAPAEYILISKVNGNYAPAHHPKVMYSEAQAQAVAEKMARQYGGEFVVFKTVSATIMPPPATLVTKRFAA